MRRRFTRTILKRVGGVEDAVKFFFLKVSRQNPAWRGGKRAEAGTCIWTACSKTRGNRANKSVEVTGFINRPRPNHQYPSTQSFDSKSNITQHLHNTHSHRASLVHHRSQGGPSAHALLTWALQRTSCEACLSHHCLLLSASGTL